MTQARKPRVDITALKKDISLFFSAKEAKTLRKDIIKMGLTAGAISMVIALQAPLLQGSQTEDGAVPVDQSLGHNDAKYAGHSSRPAPYDETCKCGGHASMLEWQHSDSVTKLK